jgi:hypothetical protein
MFYKLNFGFSVLLFLLTITYRNKILYGLTDNVKLTQSFLSVWNIIMLICLSVLFLHSIWLGYNKQNSWYYYLFGVIAFVMLAVSVIGIFLTPKGTI